MRKIFLLVLMRILLVFQEAADSVIQITTATVTEFKQR